MTFLFDFSRLTPVNRTRDYINPYPPPREEYHPRVISVLTLDSLTKHPKEILAIETQLRLPAPRPILNPLREGNPRAGTPSASKNHQCDQCKLCKGQETEGKGDNGSVDEHPNIFLDNILRRYVERTFDRRGGSRRIHGQVSVRGRRVLSESVTTIATWTVIIAECRRLEKKQMIKESVGKKEEVASTKEVLVNPSFLDQRVTIRGGLFKTCRDQLKRLLKDNLGVFACEPSDMMGIPRQVIENMLNVNPSLDPVCQKRRMFSMEKSGVVANKVAEWVKTGIVCLVRYPTYISNPNLKINMKLNSKKCSFGVKEGKFLGYMVTSEGIRANSKKMKALADLQSPQTLKEMQSMSGKLDSLNRFLAKSAKRSLPFFNTLKNITKENKHEYQWKKEAEEYF
nr:reverse transcriptase domain-containing protein [Tanacetum cinerariifolium]